MGAMIGDRINPVALVCGAASELGLACARILTTRADGGLILVDHDEASLDAAADALPQPPERVSTLALPLSDRNRWARALEFISTHYGRLDWAIVAAQSPNRGELADLDAALLALRALAPLMRENSQGGAAVLVVDAHASIKASLLQLVRVAAKEGAGAGIRVNAIVHDGADAPAWRSSEPVHDLDRATCAAIRRMSPAVARTVGYGLERLLPVVLSDRTELTGAALVVDDARAL
jgi:NAD(P)-dependent dehydrogenase (short-subunit alcohol dehydrogenase family)